MARRIDPRTPNTVMATPDTVEACQAERGTEKERLKRADQAVNALADARMNAAVAASQPRGRRQT